MSFRFENLEVWQIALKLSNEIDILSQKFPEREKFNLSSQIKRAADSVVLNIAEGSTGQSKAEFKRFLNIALRSGIEVVSCFFMAHDRSYINKETFNLYYNQYELLTKRITALKNSL